jgi:protein-S-isoprenylcysteine O-methyltransferase Ste14
MHMTLLGLFGVFPSVVLLIGFWIFLGNMHFRLLLEEDFLEGKFGDSYREYLRKTRRYI